MIILHRLKGVNLHEIYCERRKKKTGSKEGAGTRGGLQRLGYGLYCVEKICLRSIIWADRQPILMSIIILMNAIGSHTKTSHAEFAVLERLER